MLTTFGLVLICIAWLYEFSLLMKGDMLVGALFVGFYTLGVLLLVIDGFMLGATYITWLNLVSLVISFGVWVVLLKKK